MQLVPSITSLQLECTADASLFPFLCSHLQQHHNLIPQGVTPLKEVVVEDAGHARVGQDVGIALTHMVVGEGPVCLRTARVVVVNEGLQGKSTTGHRSRCNPIKLYRSLPNTHIFAVASLLAWQNNHQLRS